uniref:Uncharacterized protein n=1 Tax=Oryza punctata TaxID=4537 RepID=A0A0E0MGX5_ORYPU
MRPCNIQNLSKLPLNEAAKTSVLSSKWRCIWLKCPRLCFDGLAMFKCKRGELFLYAQQFIAQVDAVTQKHHGEVVEEFHIRFDFDSIPAHYLDNWHVQLNFVSIKPPSKFRGFPNLRKLDLQFLDVTSKDLEIMLSNCIILEWLNIHRCHLNDELRVGSPLPRLVYLQVVYCDVTKIQFHAMELATFVYEGDLVPIALKHSLKLENANIKLDSLNDRHAISDLVKAFPNLRNLNFHLSWNDAKTELLPDTPWKFSHLRPAPFIEKLEIDFWINLLLLDESHEDHSIRQQLGRCEYSNLKNMHITGYKGSREQFEFLIHVVENAPALEVLTLEGAGIEYEEVAFLMNSAWIDRITLSAKKSALIAQRYLSEKLSSKTQLCIKTT